MVEVKRRYEDVLILELNAAEAVEKLDLASKLKLERLREHRIYKDPLQYLHSW